VAGVSKRKFRCLKGFSYGPNGKHAYKPGDEVTDLPAEYVGWMLDEGTIEPLGQAGTDDTKGGG
jgi:hypothetical protein